MTFRNGENVREAARRVPAERLLIETDAPWLAPVPMRGKTNEPAFVSHTAACVAEQRSMEVDELVALTGANFSDLFRV